MGKTKEVNKTNTPYLDELIKEAKESVEKSISFLRCFSGVERSELHLEDLLEIQKLDRNTQLDGSSFYEIYSVKRKVNNKQVSPKVQSGKKS